jgi:hypothetical protein
VQDDLATTNNNQYTKTDNLTVHNLHYKDETVTGPDAVVIEYSTASPD